MLSAAAVVVCALNLLGRSQAIAPIAFHDTAPPGASRNVEAFVTRDPDTIHLVTSTAAFRDAQRGFLDSNDGCRKIASIIVHEEWHLKNGGDEEGAYLAQLMTLVQLNAASTVLSSVRRSMVVVVRAQRRLTRPELINARR